MVTTALSAALYHVWVYGPTTARVFDEQNILTHGTTQDHMDALGLGH